MIAKTVLKIEIRVRFMKIRGICQLVPLECKYKSSYLGENRLGRRLGRPEIGIFIYISLSNCSCTCICNGFNEQIPPYLSEFHSFMIQLFKVVLEIIFLGGIGRPVGSEAIAYLLNLSPHCRSLMGTSRF